MGIDLLDIKFRFERAFKVELKHEFDSLLSEFALSRQPPDIAAGELFQLVESAIQRQQWIVPADLWEQYCRGLSQVLGVDEDKIQPESLLIADLGME